MTDLTYSRSRSDSHDMLFEPFNFDASIATPNLMALNTHSPPTHIKLLDQYDSQDKARGQQQHQHQPPAQHEQQQMSDDQHSDNMFLDDIASLPIAPLSPLIISQYGDQADNDIQPLFDANTLVRPSSPPINIPAYKQQQPKRLVSPPSHPPTPRKHGQQQQQQQQQQHRQQPQAQLPVFTAEPAHLNSTHRQHSLPLSIPQHAPHPAQHIPSRSASPLKPPPFQQHHVHQPYKRVSPTPSPMPPPYVDDRPHTQQTIDQDEMVYCPSCKTQFSGNSEVLPIFYRHVGLCHLQSQHVQNMQQQALQVGNSPLRPLSNSLQHISDEQLHDCLKQLGDGERHAIMNELQRLLRQKDASSDNSSVRSNNSSTRSYNRTITSDEARNAFDVTQLMHNQRDAYRHTPSPAISNNTPETHTSSEFTPHTSSSSPSPTHHPQYVSSSNHNYHQSQHHTQHHNINVHVNVNTGNQPITYATSTQTLTPTSSYQPQPIHMPKHPLRRGNSVPEQIVVANVVETDSGYSTYTANSHKSRYDNTPQSHSFTTPTALPFSQMRLGSSPGHNMTPMMLPQTSSSSYNSNNGSYLPAQAFGSSPSHAAQVEMMKRHHRASSAVETPSMAAIAATPRYVPRDSVPAAIPIMPDSHSKSYDHRFGSTSQLSSSYNGQSRHTAALARPVMRRNSSMTASQNNDPYPTMRQRHNSVSYTAGVHSAVNSPVHAVAVSYAGPRPHTERSSSYSNRPSRNNFDFNINQNGSLSSSFVA